MNRGWRPLGLALVRHSFSDGGSEAALHGSRPYPRKSAFICGSSLFRVHSRSLFKEEVCQQFLSRIDGITAEVGHPRFMQNFFIDTESPRKAFRIAS
jgi:hypothetical protein